MTTAGRWRRKPRPLLRRRVILGPGALPLLQVVEQALRDLRAQGTTARQRQAIETAEMSIHQLSRGFALGRRS